MKKSILAAIVALFAASATISAQTQQPSQCCSNDKAKCEKAEGKKCDKKGGDDCQKGACLFQNLNLTDQQKAEIKQLKADMKESQAKAKAESKRVSREGRQQARKEWLEGVKKVLTPDQYTQFLENAYLNQGAPRGGKMMQGHQGKPGKQGKPAKFDKQGKGERRAQQSQAAKAQ